MDSPWVVARLRTEGRREVKVTITETRDRDAMLPLEAEAQDIRILLRMFNACLVLGIPELRELGNSIWARIVFENSSFVIESGARLGK